MKMIAITTIHGQKTIRARDKKDKNDLGEYEDRMVLPGSEFDTTDLSISDDEAQSLIDAGVAKQKTKEVPDNSATKIVTPPPAIPVA